MKKEDFHEGQLVVAVKESGERRHHLHTIVEVHDSHIVLSSPWDGLDAVFYENSRTTYDPATHDEIMRVRDELVLYKERIQKDLTDVNKRLSVLDESLSKLNATNS